VGADILKRPVSVPVQFGVLSASNPVHGNLQFLKGWIFSSYRIQEIKKKKDQLNL